MAGRIAAVAGCIALVGICGAGAVFLGKKLKNNAGKDVDSSIVITLDSQQASASTFADGQEMCIRDSTDTAYLITWSCLFSNTSYALSLIHISMLKLKIVKRS